MTRLARIAAAAAALVGAATMASAQEVVKLSLKEAEGRAVQNHPAIRAGEYAALAAGETVREVRSAYMPTVYGSFTGVQAQNGSVLTAGGLNNSSVFDRFAYGFSASQMLTDFGRTSNLTASASLHVDAQQKDVDARRATVLLDVDRAYFDALRARAVERVAEQTVKARQLVVDQVTALAASGLKSTLDLSFAKVNLAEAQLLLVQAKNDVNASDARLSAALGVQGRATYELAEEALPDAPPADAAMLVEHALINRPDVAEHRLARESSVKQADAERALWWPTLSLIGAAGMTPLHQVGIPNGYSAIGLNVTVPVTNGSLFAARRARAAFQASAEQQTVKDLENRVTRDVEIALLDAQTAYQKLDLTNQLLAQSTDALDLAQQRYNLGLSSIVELTQAQLNQTRAEIEQATARYEYQARQSALRYQTGDLK
ncbi:MAG TPA: TolC family protein [Vicinamibacterales bacterium]|jgi:outer membrane protein